MKTECLVTLTEEQLKHLEKLASSRTCSVWQMKRAQILLKLDSRANWSYERIAGAFNVSMVTIAKVRKAFVEHCLEAALQAEKAGASV